MDHVAIMKKSWGLLPKILAGEKTIESRWYRNKSRPWGIIRSGDIIYFKNSGEPVKVEAKVEKVLAFENLNPEQIKNILDEFGEKDGITKSEYEKYFNLFKDKNYCLLIFLKNPQEVTPFNIDKTGFGAMAAWITTENINQVVLRTE